MTGREIKFDDCKAPEGYQVPPETKGAALTMKTRRFDHIDLGVREMAAAKRFYAQVLLLPGDATGLRSRALLRDILE